MADTHETTSDIIAEMRRIRVREFQDYADRLEAAHKREIVEVSTRAATFAINKTNEEWRQKLGDCAKLREALKAIIGLCAGLMPTWDGAVGRIKDMAEAALAAPARNCDVGTAEEQNTRRNQFCYAQMKRNNHCCGPCPCYKFINGEAQSCTLLWAQMPYEEGGAV